jgi:hypothetical protein
MRPASALALALIAPPRWTGALLTCALLWIPAIAHAQAGGDVEPACTLNNDWQAKRGASGAATGQFSTMKWTIPEDVLEETAGDPTIEIEATGECNASHTITLTSVRGGLIHDRNPPAGFIGQRTLRYSARWAGVGGEAVLVASGTAGAASGSVVVNGPTPTHHTLELTVQLLRANPTDVMLAGAYSDTVTITFTPSS